MSDVERTVERLYDFLGTRVNYFLGAGHLLNGMGTRGTVNPIQGERALEFKKADLDFQGRSILRATRGDLLRYYDISRDFGNDDIHDVYGHPNLRGRVLMTSEITSLLEFCANRTI